MDISSRQHLLMTGPNVEFVTRHRKKILCRSGRNHLLGKDILKEGNLLISVTCQQVN